MKLKEIRFLEINGSNYEIGKAIGQEQKKSIKYIFDRIVIAAKWRKEAKMVFVRHQNLFPKYVSELQGMADGAGVNLMDLFAFACFEDECHFRKGDGKCTTLFWGDNKNKFVGHNEEEFSANYGKLLLVKAKLDNGKSFITLNYPGLLCGDTISINSFGMVHALDTLYPKKRYKNGFARSFIGRSLLESETIQQSKKTLSAFPNFEGLNFIIHSQKENKTLNIETYHHDFSITTMDKKIFTHSNRYLSPRFKTIPQNFPPIATFKVERATDLMNELKNPLLVNIKKVLSDHLNFPISICRHPDKKAISNAATLASVIIDLKNLYFFIANGNPCVNKYKKFRL